MQACISTITLVVRIFFIDFIDHKSGLFRHQWASISHWVRNHLASLTFLTVNSRWNGWVNYWLLSHWKIMKAKRTRRSKGLSCRVLTKPSTEVASWDATHWHTQLTLPSCHHWNSVEDADSSLLSVLFYFFDVEFLLDISFFPHVSFLEEHLHELSLLVN